MSAARRVSGGQMSNHGGKSLQETKSIRWHDSLWDFHSLASKEPAMSMAGYSRRVLADAKQGTNAARFRCSFVLDSCRF